MTFDISKTGTKFCAYLRKSRADEEHEKLTGLDTLSSHRTALYDFAEKLGAVISEEYAEVASGESLVERPEMLRLLEDVENNKWDGVFVISIDRLSRGNQRQQGIIAEAFMDSETYILTPNRIFDPLSDSDMEIFDFDLFMSRREFKTINRRLIAGRIASCRRGEHIAKAAPYGYDKVVIDGKKTLKPNDRAEYVRLVYRLYLEGMPVNQIAKRLTALGVPTAVPNSPGGNRWNPASVKNMLTNPVYVGKIRWNYEHQRKADPESGHKYTTIFRDDCLIFDGLHEAIITQEQFDAVQARFATNIDPFKNGREARNHYTGLLYCAECGIALHLSSAKKRLGLTHFRSREGCTVKGTKLDVLDNLMIAWLTATVEDMEIELETEKQPDRTSEIKALEHDLALARQLITMAMDMLEKGMITKDEFLERQSRNADRLEKATAALAELKKPTEERKARIVRIHETIEALKDPSFDVHAKNMLLRSFIKRINYTNHSEPGTDDKLVLEIELL